MVDPVVATLIGVWITATIAELGALGRLLQRVSKVETKLDERTEPVRADGGGPRIRWRNFLTGRDDPTVNGVSFLSRPREWHAVGVGFAAACVAMLGHVPEAVVGGGSYGIGRTVKSLADRPGHIRDALEETAYTALGMVLGGAVSLALLALGVVP